MSSDDIAALRVAGISKTFQTFRRPSDRLFQLLSPRWSARRSLREGGIKEFQALRDVSFSIGRGKAFGILGHNGSGKSTLLQIMAGIMTPTKGDVKVNGRITALLELGSGFNTDFTGLENIYLNASILGLSKSQINRKLDAIIDFAEIGEHIAMPVKTYSTGMVLRLAFAAQVVIEPDILIIDEALAVGDIKFQRKCIDRLNALKAGDATIVFVSHDIELVRSFCDSVLVLEKGRPIFLGDAASGVDAYLRSLHMEVSASS